MTNDNVHLAVLITMPHSHYSEKARWALDRLSVPYQEQPHAPLLHRLVTTRNGGSSVPLLLHGGAHFTDSTDILVHTDAVCGGDLLYPRDAGLRREVEALETQIDEELGPHARRWAYAQLLSQRTLLRQVMTRGVPQLEAALLPVIMPVLFPTGYRAAYPALDDVPAAMRNEVLRLRDTSAGRFALRLYVQERDRSHAVAQDRCRAQSRSPFAPHATPAEIAYPAKGGVVTTIWGVQAAAESMRQTRMAQLSTPSQAETACSISPDLVRRKSL